MQFKLSWTIFAIFLLVCPAEGFCGSFAQTLSEIGTFSKNICDDIRTDGSILKKEVEVQLKSNIGGVAKVLGGSLAVDGSIRTGETSHTNIQYEELPEQMSDARDCRRELAKILISTAKHIFYQNKDASTLLPKSPIYKTEYRDRRYDFDEKNDHCDPDRNLNIRVDADKGWFVDVKSIDAKYKTSKKSHFSGIKNQSKNGFTITGNVRNRGICFFGKGDARGHVWGFVLYKEFRFRGKNLGHGTRTTTRNIQ